MYYGGHKTSLATLIILKCLYQASKISSIVCVSMLSILSLYLRLLHL